MTPTQKKATLRQFGTNLRAARLKNRFTQASLAELVGISVAYLSLLERGGRNPPATTVVELAEATGVPPGKLLAASWRTLAA